MAYINGQKIMLGVNVVQQNVNVVQTTGESTTDVMSQKAVTDEFAAKKIAADAVIKEVTGTYTLTIPDASQLVDSLNSLKITGNTVQDGTPTPSAPIPVRCVKSGTIIQVQNSDPLRINVLTVPCDLYSGDTCTWYSDKTVVTHTMGVVDGGTLTYQYYPTFGTLGGFLTFVPEKKPSIAPYCDIYKGRLNISVGEVNYTITTNFINNIIYITDTNYTDAASMKSHMIGHKIVYKLDTPTTEEFPSQEIPVSGNTIITAFAIGMEALPTEMKANYNQSTSAALAERDAEITALKNAIISLGGNV